jgi:LPS-assembly lipoprotein
LSSDRISRRFVALGLLALSGCGFAPIYGVGSALRDMIAYETDDSVAGFRMRTRLEERLGQTTTPRYILAVTQTDSSAASAITTDGDTTRFNVIGTANWTLSDAETGAEVEVGQVRTFTGYATTGSTTATQAAATDAEDRLSVALADMIVSRVLILSTGLAQ